jgi:phosphoribosylformimino-5-aminoimidazole carboxamide ribotide isomerase
MDIIPSFDLMDGRIVRLRQGDFDQKTEYPHEPLELARQLEGAGIRRLHMVDLDGARLGRPMNLRVLEQIAARTHLSIDYGGGLRSIPNLRQVWDAGAALFSVGSVAVTAPDEFSFWVEKFGPERFLVGADVRDRRIAVHGWVEQTELHLFDLLERLQNLGVHQVSVTDIARDGEMGGPATELYTELLQRFPKLQLVASAGISSVQDLEVLANIGCNGAIVGKAFLEGKIPIEYFRVASKV